MSGQLLVRLPSAKTPHPVLASSAEADLGAKRYAVSWNRFTKDESAQLANEIRAAAARCVARDRELKVNAYNLTLDCRKLGGCK